VEPLSADLPVLQSSGVDNFSNIYALAEVIKACDLVVSIDNSTLHLASALGRPTCALIPFVADWRWFLKREDSPWYKSIKLYRQVKMGQWDDPLMQLRVDLERALAIL
jgi:ADP-heptose:LPS heptosyltransferase